jgi:acyl-CoA synthetase (AMP-forming)/AMP-acid ligase II/acyl carrier protein
MTARERDWNGPPMQPTMNRVESCKTLHELLVDRAEARADRIALLAPNRPALDYGNLARHVRRIGGWLADAGIAPKNRVAVALPEGPEMALATLGVATYMTCAPLCIGLSQREFEAAFDELRVTALIIPAGSAKAARKAAAATGVGCLEARFDDAMHAGAFELPTGMAAGAPAASEEVALLLRTSGTTSRPKRVPLRHAQLCRSASNIAATLQLTQADRCLNVMPLFHVHGLVAALLASLHAGGGVVCTPGLKAGQFVGWLREFDPTWYTAVPTLHQAVLREIEQLRRPALEHRLRFIRSSSAALAPRIAARLEAAFGVPVLEAYGMTEAAHQITSNPLPPLPRVPGSVGLASGHSVAIMDAAGNLLPAREAGEVVIRGANVISAYEDAQETHVPAFTRGWLRTGDQGWLDEQGYLRLTGRFAEIINRGGEKISPREVEDAMLEHEDVLECVVFGVAHATLGEEVTAAVVPVPGSKLDAHALRKWLAGRLSHAKIPNRVAIVDELPKGPSGKIDRTGMAVRLAMQLGTPFVVPQGDTEEQVASLFADVLGIERIGATDNFFALGGDSLRGTQLLDRLQARFGVNFALATLFRLPTPALIANEIASTVPAAAAALLPLLSRVESLTDAEATTLMQALPEAPAR